MKPPIFIIGNPRSGTTMLRLMINNHQNIVVPPECGFAVWWYDKYKDWRFDSDQNHQRLEKFFQDLFQSTKIETWNLDNEALADFALANKPANYAELVSCVYTFFGIARNKSFHRWGDKNNFHVNWILTLNEMFPDACYVHIVRDGRDVACSYRRLADLEIQSRYAPNLPVDISEIAAEWTNNVNTVAKSFEQIGWNKVIELRYEDLVADSRLVLERICGFIDEPFDEMMLNFHIYNQEEQQEPVEFLQWKRKTLKAPTTSEVGKYQKVLSRQEILDFEGIANSVLERYDYDRVS